MKHHPHLNILGSGNLLLTSAAYQHIHARPQIDQHLANMPEYFAIDKSAPSIRVKHGSRNATYGYDTLKKLYPDLKRPLSSIGKSNAVLMNEIGKTVAYYPDFSQAGSPRWARLKTIRGHKTSSAEIANLLQEFAWAVNAVGSALATPQLPIATETAHYPPLYAVGQAHLPLVMITPVDDAQN